MDWVSDNLPRSKLERGDHRPSIQGSTTMSNLRREDHNGESIIWVFTILHHSSKAVDNLGITLYGGPKLQKFFSKHCQLQPASTQCDVGPVYPNTAIFSCQLTSNSTTQCDAGPVCVYPQNPIELSSTQCDVVQCVNPVWCGPVCVPIELSSTQFDVVQCVSP